VLTAHREKGQVAVFFGLLLPVIFAIGAIVLDVGNWYVHKRHLQTQVDAAALAPAPEFTGCFDPAAWSAADGEISSHALGLAGDTKRPGVLGSNASTTTNLQVQEPGDVRIVLNSSQYWQKLNGTDPSQPAPGYGLDNTQDLNNDGSGGFCNEKAIDVKATDDDAPPLWGLIPLTPSPKTHARAEIFDQTAAESILPFAVPEVVPGVVAAIFVNEGAQAGNEVIGNAVLTQPTTPDPLLSDWAVYQGTSTAFDAANLDNVGVVMLLSKADVTLADLNPGLNNSSLSAICSQTGVRCYSGTTGQSGLALIHRYQSSGSPTPVLHQVDVTGCNGAPSLSGPYFHLTGDCTVGITSEIETGALVNFRADIHASATCGGNGTPMSRVGATNQFLGSYLLPDSDASTGQVPLSIEWQASGPGNRGCFPLVARPYLANGKSGPIEYLKLAGSGSNGPYSNPYSIPKDNANGASFTVTVGLLPPLRQMTLSDKPALIRFATENNPSETQSIDCDVDNYPYPAPYNTLPADAAEIAYGCVTPYKENPTLDCSAYGNGDLPPAAPPTTTFENAPDCAQSKNGQVSSLRKGLVARLNEPTCAPNNWPDPPITQAKIDNLITNFANDPRLVTLVVTEFGAFSGSGNTIIPIRYFAGFYITGKDISGQSPKCPGEDPHPLYGSTYKQHLDDGDIWGYFLTRVQYASSGVGGPPCNFTGAPQNCVLSLVE